MKINRNIWKTVETYGNLYINMEIYGNLYRKMKTTNEENQALFCYIYGSDLRRGTYVGWCPSDTFGILLVPSAFRCFFNSFRYFGTIFVPVSSLFAASAHIRHYYRSIAHFPTLRG